MNQKGEVITGVMVVMMVGMMIFGMVFMHGGHGNRRDNESVEHKKDHAVKGHNHMHDEQNTPEKAPVSSAEDAK